MKKNAGFGAVGIVLVVAAVALVGLIGWRLFDANKSKQSNLTTSSNQAQQSNNQAQSNTQTNTQVDTATYLDIKELGVKIKLDDKVKDATYSTRTLSDGSMVAYFSTQSLAQIDPACEASSGALGSLEKTTVDTDRTGAKKVVNNKSTFKFGDYYFSYSSPQALCSTAAQATVNDLRAALVSSLPSIQQD